MDKPTVGGVTSGQEELDLPVEEKNLRNPSGASQKAAFLHELLCRFDFLHWFLFLMDYCLEM